MFTYIFLVNLIFGVEVGKLGHPDWAIREQSFKVLSKNRIVASPVIWKGFYSDNPEISYRCGLLVVDWNTRYIARTLIYYHIFRPNNTREVKPTILAICGGVAAQCKLKEAESASWVPPEFSKWLVDCGYITLAEEVVHEVKGVPDGAFGPWGSGLGLYDAMSAWLNNARSHYGAKSPIPWSAPWSYAVCPPQ